MYLDVHARTDPVLVWEGIFCEQLLLVIQGHLSICPTEVTEVVRKPQCGLAPGVDEIRPWILKALDSVGVSYLKCLLSITWRLATVPMDWLTRWLPVLKGTGGCVTPTSVKESTVDCWTSDSDPVMVGKNSGQQGFLERFIVATLPKIKSDSTSIRSRYFIFIKYNIRLIKLQVKQTVVLHHTGNAVYLMNEVIV